MQRMFKLIAMLCFLSFFFKIYSFILEREREIERETESQVDSALRAKRVQDPEIMAGAESELDTQPTVLPRCPCHILFSFFFF